MVIEMQEGESLDSRILKIYSIVDCSLPLGKAIGNCVPSGGSAKEIAPPKGNIVIPRGFSPEG